VLADKPAEDKVAASVVVGVDPRGAWDICRAFWYSVSRRRAAELEAAALHACVGARAAVVGAGVSIGVSAGASGGRGVG